MNSNELVAMVDGTVLAVTCPICRAAPGAKCTKPTLYGSNFINDSVHLARMDASKGGGKTASQQIADAHTSYCAICNEFIFRTNESWKHFQNLLNDHQAKPKDTYERSSDSTT